ncbi:sperm acrosome-associated protein 7-like [Acomys russatus]|uniref:sperm acrosome-associated protein 7-like n=1 Tax=Acomys russatus TaxID=60746 RepID=UPI0021E2A704|nr:sperm acrosome-associated protein 7-like [Acomys russatus]
MAANRGAGTFLSVFLLCCWRDAARPWPNREPSGFGCKQLPSYKTLDDDVATVFDEILVREILEPEKTSYFEDESPSITSQLKTTKDKKVNTYESSAPKKQEKQQSSGTIDILSFDDEEKETLYQLKSLEALEKIIKTIRRALGTHLRKKLKLQKSTRTRQLLGG